MAAKTKKIINNIKTPMKSVKVPDLILAEPVQKKMSFRRKMTIIFVVGFLAGWLWMTWAMIIEPPVGLDNYSFWRLLLPF